MLKNTLLAAAIFICAYLLGSASVYPPWRSPTEYPLDFRVVSPKGATVATMTSERRSIIIVPDARSGANADLRICPEPPADAADNVASLLTGSASGSAGALNGENKGSAALSSGSSAALASIFARSQGIELFRDGSNALCLAWLNDIYNNGDVNAWRSDFQLLLKTSSMLISQEIAQDQFNKQVQTPLPAVVAAPADPTIPNSSIAPNEPTVPIMPLGPFIPDLPFPTMIVPPVDPLVVPDPDSAK